MSCSGRIENIRATFLQEHIFEAGCHGCWEPTAIDVTIRIDPRQTPREILATILHEYIEIVARIENIPLTHPDHQDALAYPLTDLLLAHGFNPFCLFSPQRDDTA